MVQIILKALKMFVFVYGKLNNCSHYLISSINRKHWRWRKPQIAATGEASSILYTAAAAYSGRYCLSSYFLCFTCYAPTHGSSCHCYCWRGMESCLNENFGVIFNNWGICELSWYYKVIKDWKKIIRLTHEKRGNSLYDAFLSFLEKI